MTREEQTISNLKKLKSFHNGSYGTDIDRAIKVLEQEPCEDWYDVPSNEMTLGQARQAVKDLRKKLKEHLEQEPCDEYGNYKYPNDIELTEPNTATSIPCGDAISRQAVEKITWEEPSYTDALNVLTEVRDKIRALPPVNPQPKTGHWSRKTKVDAYDIAGVKTWGIKCQCDRCDFTTIVVEDFGYYKFCPNCGAKMVDPQESEDKQ